MTDIGLPKTTPLPAGHTLRVTRRHLLTGAAGLVGLSAAATVTYAGAIEPMELIVTRYAPKPPAWPAGHKLSIAVIADIHAGGPNMTLPHIRHIVDTANALQPDLIVLLGDLHCDAPVRDRTRSRSGMGGRTCAARRAAGRLGNSWQSRLVA